MGEINISDYKKVHFVGVGGVSMSFLAEVLHNRGLVVTGSDREESKLTQGLREKGIDITIGHFSETVTDHDLIVFNSAIKSDNPERIKAEELNIKVIHRASLLGTIMEDFKYPICISGTHGKTTTTSMVSEIFIAAQKKPTISVGGMLPSIGGNSLLGEKDYFIVESDEYFDTFLKFYPHVGVILNVETDHLDYFRGLDHIIESFNRFSKNIDEEGTLVINNDIIGIEKIINDLKCNIVTYSISRGEADIWKKNLENDFSCPDWVAKNIVYDKGIPTFDVYYQSEFLGTWTLGVSGEHNVYNSLAAGAAAYSLGIGIEFIKEGLANYSGTKRRYEFKGTFNNVSVIDDYAHHPTEIEANLKTAVGASENRNVWVVFQPHTYSRTIALLDDFAKTLAIADKIVVLDIYAARENDTGIVHSKDIVDKLKLYGKENDSWYFGSFNEAEEFLLKNCIPNDLLITMGAGNVYLLGESLLRTKLSTTSTGF